MSAFRRVLPAVFFASFACLGLQQAAFASSLPAGCNLEEQARLPLTFTDDMRPVGKATVNGASVAAMLSTGAAESAVFNKKTMDRLGIEVRSSTSLMFGNDERNPRSVDFWHEISHAAIKDFSIGLGQAKSGTYKVEDFMDDTYGVRIGAGTLLQNDLEIALDAGYLKVFRPQGCFRGHLAYWDPQAVAVPAMSDPWKRDARLVFETRIDGRRVAALLSTSTPYSYVSKAAALRLGLTPDSPGAVREDPLPGDDADKPVWKLPLPQMSIGPLEVRNLDLRLMDLPYHGDLLVLGADFLHRYRIYVAVSQQQIYFSPVGTARSLRRGSVDVIPQAPN